MIDDAQLIQYLTQNNLIAQADLQHAQKLQMLEGGFLYDVLIQQQLGSEENLVNAAAELLGVQCIHLDHFEFDPDAVQLLSASMAERNNVFPLAIQEEDTGKELILAMTDPLDIMTMDEIASHTGVDIQPILAGRHAIQRAIKRAYSAPAPKEADDPFANLSSMATSKRNPEDSWAAFFDEAQQQPQPEDAEDLSHQMRDRRQSGPFESLAPSQANLAEEDSEPVLDLGEWQVEENQKGPSDSFLPSDIPTKPKPDIDDDSNIFGKFLAEDSEDDEQFNGTMLGSPLRSLSGLKSSEISDVKEESEAFDLFAPAASIAEEKLDAEASESNNFTQIGLGSGFEKQTIPTRPKSNPKAKKLETLRKRLQNKSEAQEAPEAPPQPVDMGFNLDSIVDEAADALKSEVAEEPQADLQPIEEALLVEEAAPATAPEPIPEPTPEPAPEPPQSGQPKVAAALGRLQLKKLSIPKKSALPNKIVEKDSRTTAEKPNPLDKEPPKQTPASEPKRSSKSKTTSPLSQQAILRATVPVSEAVDLEDIPEISDISEISEMMDPSEAQPTKRPNVLGAFLEPSEVYDDFKSKAITGTSSTIDPVDLTAPSEEPSEIEDEPVEQLEDIPVTRTEQATEANAALTIEHVQQMQSQDADPHTIDVMDIDIEGEEPSEAIDESPPEPPERGVQQTISNPAVTIERVREMQTNEYHGNRTQIQFQQTAPKPPEDFLPAHLTDHQIIRAIALLLIQRGYFSRNELIEQAENLPEHQSLSDEQLAKLAERFSK